MFNHPRMIFFIGKRNFASTMQKECSSCIVTLLMPSSAILLGDVVFNSAYRARFVVWSLVEAWRFLPFYGCELMLCRITPFVILWLVWKEKNDKIAIKKNDKILRNSSMAVNSFIVAADFKVAS